MSNVHAICLDRDMGVGGGVGVEERGGGVDGGGGG